MKLAKSDKQSGNHIQDSPHLASPSALSRSMKYAEPWLYGTVRGVPNANASNYDYIQPQFTLMPELAVVLCSCREYLTGTKRDLKKATVCKKCKGSRLPLTPVGGTVRIHSSQCIVQTNNRNSVGTVRLPSAYATSKQRPSILNADSDPYDIMRRSRLLSPDLKAATRDNAKPAKNRAKSSSPTRNKDRYLKQNPAVPVNGMVKNENRSRSATRPVAAAAAAAIAEIDSSWTDSLDTSSMTDGGTARRSILQCSVNPYELISKTLHNNEFSPLGDDDVYDMHSQKYENLLNSLHGGNKSNNRGNMVNGIGTNATRDRANLKRLSTQMNTSVVDNVYEKFNFPNSQTSTYSKTPSKENDTNTNAMYSPGNMKGEPLAASRVHNIDGKVQSDETESTKTSLRSECGGPAIAVVQDPSPAPVQMTTLHSASVETGNSSSTIKSILKRPPPPLAANGSDPSTNDKNTDDTGHEMSKNGTQSKGTVARRSPKKVTATATTIFSADQYPAAGGTIRNTKINIQHSMAAANNHASKGNQRGGVATAANATADGNMKVKRNSGSHFYLPLPQRKKVQFLVEHEIIDENSNIESGHAANDNGDGRLTDALVNGAESSTIIDVGDGQDATVTARTEKLANGHTVVQKARTTGGPNPLYDTRRTALKNGMDTASKTKIGKST